MNNLFSDLPETLEDEQFVDLLQRPGLRIERILSKGHSSPETGWYDQEEHEWVLVLEGSGCLQFEDGRELTLNKGDHINIPAHCRHRVIWTDPQQITIWLAVFYQNEGG